MLDIELMGANMITIQDVSISLYYVILNFKTMYSLCSGIILATMYKRRKTIYFVRINWCSSNTSHSFSDKLCPMSKNFQDILLCNYQHYLWFSTLPNQFSLQSGTINILESRSPNVLKVNNCFCSLTNYVQSWSNLQDMSLSNYQHNFDTIILISSQEPSTSSKLPCNQDLFFSWSLAETSLLLHHFNFCIFHQICFEDICQLNYVYFMIL